MSHIIIKPKGNDLKFAACPFCGKAPEWVELPVKDYIMRCSSCYASTKIARWSLHEAAADWNALDIEDDHYSITADIKIDDYFTSGIRKILFSEYSNIHQFPEVEDGFLCSEAVIITDEIMICIEEKKTCLLYDEINGCEYAENAKSISEDGAEIRFVKSLWDEDRLLSLTFSYGERIINISPCPEYECLIVREK